MKTVRVPIHEVSLTEMNAAGFDVSDEGNELSNHYGYFGRQELLQHLTAKQRRVLFYYEKGYSREDIAMNLVESVQAVHQIILRIRKRLSKRAGIIPK